MTKQTKTQIDHLVIGAASLAEGVTFVREQLGVDIPEGGEHLSMGTHNHLMQLGEGVFLEVISIHPDIEPPPSPRWYGLDDPFVRQRIEQRPVLLTWVVNSVDIHGFMNGASVDFGEIESVSRGSLNWLFGLPEDGRLLAGGMLPYVIQWQTDTHPSTGMTNLGCRLLGLELYHPRPEWLLAVLESIDAQSLVKVYPLHTDDAPYLLANIETPTGIRQLYSAACRPNRPQEKL